MSEAKLVESIRKDLANIRARLEKVSKQLDLVEDLDRHGWEPYTEDELTTYFGSAEQ